MAKAQLGRRVQKLEQAALATGRKVMVWARSEEEYAREAARLRAAGAIRQCDEVQPYWAFFEGEPQDEVIVLSDMSHEDWLAHLD